MTRHAAVPGPKNDTSGTPSDRRRPRDRAVEEHPAARPRDRRPDLETRGR